MSTAAMLARNAALDPFRHQAREDLCRRLKDEEPDAETVEQHAIALAHAELMRLTEPMRRATARAVIAVQTMQVARLEIERDGRFVVTPAPLDDKSEALVSMCRQFVRDTARGLGLEP